MINRSNTTEVTKTIQVERKVLLKTLKSVLPFIYKNEIRYNIYHCELSCEDNKIIFTATDGNRLLSIKIAHAMQFDEFNKTENLYMQPAEIKEIIKFLSASKARDVDIQTETTKQTAGCTINLHHGGCNEIVGSGTSTSVTTLRGITCHDNGTYYFSNKRDKIDFPDYKRVIPQSYITNNIKNIQKVYNNVQRALKFTKATTNQIMTISMARPSTFQIKHYGEDIYNDNSGDVQQSESAHFNAWYLQDCLAVFDRFDIACSNVTIGKGTLMIKGAESGVEILVLFMTLKDGEMEIEENTEIIQFSKELDRRFGIEYVDISARHRETILAHKNFIIDMALKAQNNFGRVIKIPNILFFAELIDSVERVIDSKATREVLENLITVLQDEFDNFSRVHLADMVFKTSSRYNCYSNMYAIIRKLCSPHNSIIFN
jgi:DNA polymerase III sliding clamp (beta) subunit (PCNA family)